ncbi:MAG TPA: oxygen-independent coproporphyrinogen III oxidase [Gammaproteobacteria bacterium]|jgi:oxygen-independent coproporphyrinogen-3 oxidase|nr:oxygen-independent coproporphyrinogen III oxidase [Gammaproteobacteria bacterium]
MSTATGFDPDLITRYDKSGPRYTSYPTALSFTPAFTEADYQRHAIESHQAATPLSLYVHIPFCDTICYYCACNKISTKDRSKADRYLDYLGREITLQSALFDAARPVEQLHFGGGTPTFLTVDQMQSLIKMLGQHFQLLDRDQGEYSIEIDPRSVTPDTIKSLRDLGFTRFSLGVQDVNPYVQKAINRIQPASMNRQIFEACRDFGAKSISMDLIYGLPLQTRETFAATLDEIISMSPDRLSVFNYAHMPAVFRTQRRIREADLPTPQVRLEILDMAIQRLTEAGYVYIGMDHFAKPDDELSQALRDGSLHRNFQGYTTHADCDLIGLGVSSIGSVCGAYSQNEKSLLAYYAEIDAGSLPIARGLSLTADDRLRRTIIQQLACQFQLDMRALPMAPEIDVTDYFAEELHQLQALQEDGLVRCDEGLVQVTPRGRFLIRNICMVFDRRLREQQGPARYSKVI